MFKGKAEAMAVFKVTVDLFSKGTPLMSGVPLYVRAKSTKAARAIVTKAERVSVQGHGPIFDKFPIVEMRPLRRLPRRAEFANRRGSPGRVLYATSSVLHSFAQTSDVPPNDNMVVYLIDDRWDFDDPEALFSAFVPMDEFWKGDCLPSFELGTTKRLVDWKTRTAEIPESERLKWDGDTVVVYLLKEDGTHDEVERVERDENGRWAIGANWGWVTEE